MTLQSLHTHTVFCDGKDTAEEMVRGAMAAGCRSLGFSGHSPLPFDDSWTMKEVDVPRYREEVLRLRDCVLDFIHELWPTDAPLL